MEIHPIYIDAGCVDWRFVEEGEHNAWVVTEKYGQAPYITFETHEEACACCSELS